MDERDSALVKELQRDARQTNRELARRLDIAPSTCLERVRALHDRGVIHGYHAEVDMAALNRGVQAFVAVQIRPLSRAVIDGFQEFVTGLPQVVSVFVVAGGEDFLVHVAVQDLNHLHAFLVDRLSRRREIVSYRSSVIYQQAHNTVLAPLPEP